VVNVSVCTDFLANLGGRTAIPGGSFNLSRIPAIVCHSPAGSSVFNLMHWMQCIRNNTFAMFDYGPEGNQEKYGQLTPPAYHLANVTVPTAMFTGSQDTLADPLDYQRLLSELPASTVVYQHNEREFAHLDFSWSLQAAPRIYGTIVDLLRRAAGLE